MNAARVQEAVFPRQGKGKSCWWALEREIRYVLNDEGSASSSSSSFYLTQTHLYI